MSRRRRKDGMTAREAMQQKRNAAPAINTAPPGPSVNGLYQPLTPPQIEMIYQSALQILASTFQP